MPKLTECITKSGLSEEDQKRILGSIDKYKDLSEVEANRNAIRDYHESLAKDLNKLRETINKKSKEKLPLVEYKKPSHEEEIKAINEDYDQIIKNISSQFKPTENAETVRSDQGQVGGTGQVTEGGKNISGEDLQLNAPQPSEPSKTEPIASPEEKVTSQGGGNNVGVSHAALTDLAQKLGLKEPERGQFYELEWYAERGRRLLKAGADPNEVNNPNNELHDRIAISRAHLENLVKGADEIGKANGFDSKEYLDELQKVQDYSENVVKKLGTLAHRAFESLQGNRDLDTDSFTAVKQSFTEATGDKPNAAQEQKIKSLTETNKKLKQQADDAEAKLIIETEKAFKEGVEEGKKKTKSEKAKTIANKLRENAKLHKPNSFSAATPASLVWDTAVEIVAKGIEAGGKLAYVIEEGLKYIRDTDWYKSLSDDKKNNAEQEFKQWHNDTVGSKNLEDLQARFVNKTGNKFTREEARDIWGYMKETYLDNGLPYKDAMQQVSQDLGLSWRQVSDAITTPKVRPISDAMWKKQSDYRRNQLATKNWIDEQDKNPFTKALKKVSGVFRGVAVFGHGGIFMGTHAGMTLFQPSTWSKTIPAFFRGWKYAYFQKVGSYEMEMEAFKNRPNYVLAQRAGLKNNPDRLTGEEFQKSQKYLGRLGLAGERGFNAVKVLRQDLFDFHYNKLSDVEKADPNAVKNIAKLVNNATGATNLNIPEWVNEVSFAGGMEAARWGKLTRNPVKAAVVALKSIYNPSKVGVGERVFAKVWARRVGEQLATFTGLLLANAAIQKQVNPKNPTNLTDPDKPDYMKFKFGDLTLDPTSGMRGVAMFIYGIGKIPFEEKKQLKGDTRVQALGKSGIGYGRGKLAPLYSTLADFYAQQDFNRNPLPFSEDEPTAGHHKLSWIEYAWEKAPLPVAEAANVTYQSAIDNGADKKVLNDYLFGLLSGGVSGSTGFRVGEYNAEASNRSPFTEEDKKDKTFKYFLDKGMELPNTSLNSEIITDDESATKKKINEYTKDIQEKYNAEHKQQLKEALNSILEDKTVYVKYYKDSKGKQTSEVSINEPKGEYKEVNVDNLTKEELAQVLSIAQKQATVNAKEKIFGQP